MKVVVERSGGFAGISRRGERDGAALSSDQHAELEKLMKLYSGTIPTDPGADRYTYRIEVHDDTGARSITLPESAVPRCLADIASTSSPIQAQPQSVDADHVKRSRTGNAPDFVEARRSRHCR